MATPPIPILLICLLAVLTACDSKKKLQNNPEQTADQNSDQDPVPPTPPPPQYIDFSVKLIGLANLDRDNGLSEDFSAPLSSKENDLLEWEMPEEQRQLIGEDGKIRLKLPDGGNLIRVWHDDELVLGKGGDPSYVIEDTASIALKFDFGGFNAAGKIIVEQLDKDDKVLGTGQILLQAAPLIMNHHLQPSERVFALEIPGNEAFITKLKEVLGDQFTALSSTTYDQDVWVQDEIEFATSVDEKGKRQDIIIDSIRDRGLKPLASNISKPEGVIKAWGNPSQATTFDSFGNLETSPPIKVDGVNYPFGRIYYGSNGKRGEGLNPILADFLASQTIQKPFAIDTAWLCVGHVDEISSFVPYSSSPKGFKLLLADVTEAYKLLESVPATTALPKYTQRYRYATVGAILADNALRTLNENLQATILDGLTETFKKELGLDDTDIIKVPSLFENDSCNDGTYVALVPGMVNFLIANDSNNVPNLFVPDPFIRASTTNQAGDPFIKKFADSMPKDVVVHFVDDWETYHLAEGELHCGSNTQRKPIADWWKTENLLTKTSE
ncbi:protein-arginine deiminase family protein [Oligoflexus tunisiensis]|uniref:protein-arginine deiminase family protein n=1 Tax=Oligoflexus tunisiensis TaxID=708132 RepID=UPI00114C9BD0|nr:protein-arginine deiminase family protein [Oligoflexus tunisiensis]